MNLKTKFIFFVLILATVFSGHSRPLSPAPEIAGDVAPPPVQKADYSSSAFKPGIVVIVGVLTTVFSVTFLLLLYVKHCKGNISGEPDYFYYRSATGFPVDGRKNSGINPLVIESLPVFRFGSLIGGQKEGLECAVCLNRFEPAEVLRLLPKCKHAFHVECIDTWLDSHSTCPLCRFRIDPEDVLLVDRFNPVGFSHEDPLLTESTRRVSGRHSSAGERGRGGVQTTSSRRSCDGSFGSISAVHRKDGLLMTTVDNSTSKPTSDRRVSHRIIVSSDPSGAPHIRWSDVHPCDLFYLRSEMLMNEGRQSSASKGGQGSQHTSRVQEILSIDNGRSVINERSVSEITGLSRLQPGGGGRQRQRHTGIVSRWTAWNSQSRPALRPGI